MIIWSSLKEDVIGAPDLAAESQRTGIRVSPEEGEQATCSDHSVEESDPGSGRRQIEALTLESPKSTNVHCFSESWTDAIDEERSAFVASRVSGPLFSGMDSCASTQP